MRIAVAFLIVLSVGAAPTAKSSLPPDLQAQINMLYQKSVVQCGLFYAGNQECIKSQFSLNYHWEILKDQDPSVGSPGIPGPMSWNEAGRSTANRTKRAR